MAEAACGSGSGQLYLIRGGEQRELPNMSLSVTQQRKADWGGEEEAEAHRRQHRRGNWQKTLQELSVSRQEMEAHTIRSLAGTERERDRIRVRNECWRNAGINGDVCRGDEEAVRQLC